MIYVRNEKIEKEKMEEIELYKPENMIGKCLRKDGVVKCYNVITNMMRVECILSI